MDTDLLEDLRSWLDESWDPALTVGEWWMRLGLSGWATPTWPTEWFGKGLSNHEAAQVHRTIVELGALPGPAEIGILLAGPTIIAHGSDEQKARYLPDLVTGRAAWCQLFSEPAAGSDLAGLQTRAERTDDGWAVNGQKVWTSSAHLADLGMLIARTDPAAPKHRGITYFVIDMHQAAVSIRPLREMTGRALFNEVFLTDAVVDADAVIGGVGQGWAVANTTLAHERTGLGAGGNSRSSGAHPGSVVGHLDRCAGEVLEAQRAAKGRSTPLGTSVQALIEAARRHDRLDDPLVRQSIARLHARQEIGRYLTGRHKALRARGGDLPGFANLAKLAMSQMFAETRDAGMGVLGARAMLHDYRGGGPARTPGDGADRAMVELALWSPGPPVYGGTDQIQRNILAERVLGLPRDDLGDRDTPFRDLPRNV